MEPRSRETTPTKEDLEFIVDDGYRHDEDPDYVPNEKYVVTGSEFKRLTRNAKKLGAETLDYSTRKNNKYMATLPGGKKVHFGSPKYPDYTIHKDKERRDKYLSRATKIKNKQGELTYTNPESKNEYGPDLASSLSSPFYYKQIEYTDKKGKKRTKVDESSAPVLYAKLIYSEKSRKILSLFKGKGGRDLNPFKYINQYCNVKLALIIEGIFISKTVTSLQIKVHECYVKELEPRKSLLTIDEKSSDSDIDSDSDSEGITDQVVDELLLSDEENK
ncbi:unnamed protein product [Porites evermanni]|uniref:Uncharacterized protein n=1 Tax=Porites evermanni TaxID=104178 RepID=A0ABN8SQ87_9CNID|nr:unnamed protein product [Porites evermanni]